MPNIRVAQNCGEDSSNESLNETDNESALFPGPPKTTVIQRGAPQDLDVVSWDVNKPMPWRLNGYVYDVFYGRDTYIYVIDNGLNLNNSVRNSRILL